MWKELKVALLFAAGIVTDILSRAVPAEPEQLWKDSSG